MTKRSILAKILIIVILAMALPAILSATNPVCTPPYCESGCPAGTYDCTNSWMYESWTNFQTCLALWYMGYSILVCCLE